MQRTTRALSEYAVTLLLAATLSAASASAKANAQSALRMPEPAALNGRSYGIEFNHVVTFTSFSGAQVHRDVQYRVSLAAAPGGRGVNVRVDSARGSASNPHVRSVLDLRPFVGTSLGVTYADSGKPVRWAAGGPMVEFADIGGAMPLSLMLDPMFPALPARDVRNGATWERTWTRSALVGQHIREAAVRTRYTIEASERVAGAQAWRVRFVTTPVAGAAPGEQSSGTMVIGADGVLHELMLEETSSGRDWVFSTEEVPYTQREQVHIVLRPAAGARR